MEEDIHPETLRALRSFDSCAVANAIETFGVQLRNEGYIDDSIQCRLPELPPMVGFAVTLRVRTSNPAMDGSSYLDRTDWWSLLQESARPICHGHPGRGSSSGTWVLSWERFTPASCKRWAVWAW